MPLIHSEIPNRISVPIPPPIATNQYLRMRFATLFNARPSTRAIVVGLPWGVDPFRRAARRNPRATIFPTERRSHRGAWLGPEISALSHPLLARRNEFLGRSATDADRRYCSFDICEPLARRAALEGYGDSPGRGGATL
jgi:hypothetical protein